MVDMHPTLGSLIRGRREALGLSQDELAERITEHQTAISKWELDQRSPSVPQLRALSAVLGISLGDLDRMAVAA